MACPVCTCLEQRSQITIQGQWYVQFALAPHMFHGSGFMHVSLPKTYSVLESAFKADSYHCHLSSSLILGSSFMQCCMHVSSPYKNSGFENAAKGGSCPCNLSSGMVLDSTYCKVAQVSTMEFVKTLCAEEYIQDWQLSMPSVKQLDC